MSRRRLRLVADGSTLATGFAAIRAELALPPTFTDDVLAAADASARRGPSGADRVDATDLPLVTIDPPGSMDLDQALYLERRRPGGYRLSYAIADVGAFVRDGDPLDVEARRRVETIYSPDTRTPLHPPVLSEGAASLLPGAPRPAVLWQLDLDDAGECVHTHAVRATVRSRARLSYEEAQQAIDAGTADDSLQLLRVVGDLRQRIERERGGVDLGRPEQEVVPRDGGWTLQYRAALPVEGWNAQVSLLTGMAAAQLMIQAKVGVLRTMPPPIPADIERLRRTAHGLGIEWPTQTSYADLVHGLDSRRDNHAAFLAEATVLLRGAGYTAFDGSLPEQLQHSAVAAPYAHGTAPLRRLVDRFVSEVCLAVASGHAVPDDVRAALPALPELMADGDRRASALERACIDLVEAAVLAPYLGRQFTAVVVDVRSATATRPAGGIVQLARPAVLGFCVGDLPLGHRVTVRLTQADVAQRQVRFELVESE